MSWWRNLFVKSGKGNGVGSDWSRWLTLPVYEKFEQLVVLVLTALIAVIVFSAMWSLVAHLIEGFALTGRYDPSDDEAFQAFFGAILTVIIALEFKRSILVVAERRHGIVQVRAVILIGMLAIIRKLIIVDLTTVEPVRLAASAAAIFALGVVYWLVRDQDRKDRLTRDGETEGDAPAAEREK